MVTKRPWMTVESSSSSEGEKTMEHPMARRARSRASVRM